MFNIRSQRPSLLVGGFTLLATMTITSLGLAGKPNGSGGSTIPGTIVFHWISESVNGGDPEQDLGYWKMNADGSGKTQVYGADGDLSHGLYNGHRWYVVLDSQGGGAERGRLYAVRDDGDPASAVLLLDADELPGRVYLNPNPRWGKDDTFISAVTWNSLDSVSELWVMDIVFDPTTGIPALASVPAVVVAEFNGASIGFHDWSPNGDKVVYSLYDDSDYGVDWLIVADLVSGESFPLVADLGNPRWSPDGSKIACQTYGNEIITINPDGSGQLLIGETGHLGDWSPDSQYLTFSRTWQTRYKGFVKYYDDVMIVPAGGGAAVNLTKDIDGSAFPRFWR